MLRTFLGLVFAVTVVISIIAIFDGIKKGVTKVTDGEQKQIKEFDTEIVNETCPDGSTLARIPGYPSQSGCECKKDSDCSDGLTCLTLHNHWGHHVSGDGQCFPKNATDDNLALKMLCRASKKNTEFCKKAKKKNWFIILAPVDGEVRVGHRGVSARRNGYFGKKWFIANFKNNQLHGDWTKWHSNGEVEEIGQFCNGKRCGKWNCYYQGTPTSCPGKYDGYTRDKCKRTKWGAKCPGKKTNKSRVKKLGPKKKKKKKRNRRRKMKNEDPRNLMGHDGLNRLRGDL